MKKKLLSILLLLNIYISFSQEIVNEFDLKLERKRDFFQVTNEPKKEVVLFLYDKEKITSVRFNNKFNINDSLTAQRPEKLYAEILGYSQKENNYSIFWGSKDRKKIISQFFDFTTKQSGTTAFNLDLKKEKIVKELTINNLFYLITIVKNSSILNFYIFDSNGNLNTKKIDLSTLDFHNSLGSTVLLYTALTEEFSNFYVQNINNDNAPSLALSSKPFKIYTYKNNEIILTIDNNAYFTDLLKINLTDFSFVSRVIDQPSIRRGEYESLEFKSNSFLIEDKILQIKTNPEVLFFKISDLDGNKINEYKTLRDEEIPFKNSDVFQEIGSLKHKKVLEKPKQFIRKINNSNPSISCYNLDGLYYTVIGSSQDIARAGAPMSMGGGFGASGFGTTSYFPGNTYTIENLISYRDKNVVYVNCLFDSNFNHVNDKIKTSAFEKARTFLEESENLKETPSIFGTELYKDLILFKFDTSLYLGNYNKENKKYQIFKFSE